MDVFDTDVLVSMILQFTLSWPDAGLNPNKRHHWSKVAKLKKSAKASAWAETMFATHYSKWAQDGKIPVSLIFKPPDKRKRDLDNMLASMKAALDGMAEALGVDDHRFVLTLEVCEPVKRGQVIVQIRSR